VIGITRNSDRHQIGMSDRHRRNTHKVTAKRKKIAASFQKYSGVPSPESLDPEKFAIVQANLLSGLLNDLNSITV
jgi:hypothetical protein